MKKKTVSLLLILCLVFSVFALASCGKGEKAGAATGDPDASGSSAADNPSSITDKWEIFGSEVSAIAAQNRRFTIEYSQFVAPEKIAKNREYLAGPDESEIVEGVTPSIQMMVYERNKAASELLGTTITYVDWDHDKASWGQAANQIKTLVQGNASDAPDMFVNMIYDLNLVLLTVGAFKDVTSIPGSYFDFSTDGWMTEWMNSMSFTGDRAYVLAGDYFLDVLRAMGVLPFNMTMMDANAEKLAPSILGEGETLGDNEELTTCFFDVVDQGKWTWDMLGKLCEAIWEDTDGNGADSIGDRLGIIADEYGGVSSSIYIYSCGEELIERKPVEDESNPHNGDNWLYYPATPGVLNDIFDAVASVFSGQGSFSVKAPIEGSTPDNPGLAYQHIKFGQGELLTAGACLLAELEDDAFQQMRDTYSIVPMPKVNVESKYNTFVTNTGDAGAINVKTGPEKTRVISAYVQYCTEHSAEIREEFLETVTKYKTTTYNQGTARMLDIIYKSVRYGGSKVVEDAVGGNNRWHQMMKGNQFTMTSSDLASQYESCRSSKQSTLNGIIEKWYALPTANSAPEKAE